MNNRLNEQVAAAATNGIDTQAMMKRIVVVDNAFVFVGDCQWDEQFLQIHNAKCIRQWGTTKGLGELIQGPTNKTVLDEAGLVFVPKARVVFLMKVNVEAW